MPYIRYDTLHFVLEGDKFEYSYDELMNQIINQRENFIERHNHYPEFINVSLKIYEFLKRKTVEEVHFNFGSINSIYGMTIKTRKEENVETLGDSEDICL